MLREELLVAQPLLVRHVPQHHIVSEHGLPGSVLGRVRNTDLLTTMTSISEGGFAVFAIFIVGSAAIIAGVAGSATIVMGLASAAVDDHALYQSGARAVVMALIGVANEGCLRMGNPEIRHTHRPTDGSGGR